MLIKQISGYLRRMRQEFPKIKNRSQLSLYTDFLWCYFRYGTVLDQYVRGAFYALSRNERSASMTYRRISKVYDKSIDDRYVHFLQNKIDFNIYFKDIITRQWLAGKMLTLEAFSEICKNTDELIIKPIGGNEGRGIYALKSPKDDNSILQVFKSLQRGGIIIEEKLTSHKEMRFGSKSLNTIRVHSVIDADGNVHIIKPILRCGVGDTVVDNYCAGGCIYELDPATGKIISEGYSKKHPRSAIHPGTDIRMPGRTVPYWDQATALVTKAHKKFPYIKYIGWDIAITDKGAELIEGNHHPDYDLLEFVGSRFYWPTFKKLLNL